MDSVEDCVSKIHNGVNDHCKDVFEAVKACHSEGTWSKCLGLYQQLQKCAVKNKLGELA